MCTGMALIFIIYYSFHLNIFAPASLSGFIPRIASERVRVGPEEGELNFNGRTRDVFFCNPLLYHSVIIVFSHPLKAVFSLIKKTLAKHPIYIQHIPPILIFSSSNRLLEGGKITLIPQDC